ncbi:MAG: PQQ-binding-like beta-propeller repeat protein, partial [Planctomycetota bacterium]
MALRLNTALLCCCWMMGPVGNAWAQNYAETASANSLPAVPNALSQPAEDEPTALAEEISGDKATVEAKEPEKVDITENVREYNDPEKFASPPDNFRKGHIAPKVLAKEAIRKTESGFQVQFPSKAPVPTVAVYEGKIYVGGGFHSREFYCLDAETGEPKWGFSLDDDGPSAPAVEDGIVVYNTESCTIFAHDAETGEYLWSHWLGDPLMSAPTIADGKVFTAYPAAGRIKGNAVAAGGQGGFQSAPGLQSDDPYGSPPSTPGLAPNAAVPTPPPASDNQQESSNQQELSGQTGNQAPLPQQSSGLPQQSSGSQQLPPASPLTPPAQQSALPPVIPQQSAAQSGAETSQLPTQNLPPATNFNPQAIQSALQATPSAS